jgi:hypothetical protein
MGGEFGMSLNVYDVERRGLRVKGVEAPLLWISISCCGRGKFHRTIYPSALQQMRKPIFFPSMHFFHDL